MYRAVKKSPVLIAMFFVIVDPSKIASEPVIVAIESECYLSNCLVTFNGVVACNLAIVYLQSSSVYYSKDTAVDCEVVNKRAVVNGNNTLKSHHQHTYRLVQLLRTNLH